MKLKIKHFNWLAGRPVVILNNETAHKLNVHVDERVCLYNKKRVYAVVDIFPKLVKTGEIGLSHEISSLVELKEGQMIEVSSSDFSPAGQLIKRKLAGDRLNEKEIEKLISEIVQNNLTESEIAYFVAAEGLKGMSSKEVYYLTKAMVKVGHQLKFKQKIIADKHCIGGIAGNRTTPIVVSICAAAGLTIPKSSSRAITSAAGTADTMETIANVELSFKELKNIVKKTGACLIWGGSLGLAPSDDKIIRVERLLNLDIEPQMIASIISKKIAAGSNHILIDFPYGTGAKLKTVKEAEVLAKKFLEVAKHFNVKMKIVFTDGNKPIGNGIGPTLEMIDVISVLKCEKEAPQDLKEKSLYLASELMSLCGIKDSKKKAIEILESKKAYEKFKEIVNAQNKKNDFDLRVKNLITAGIKKEIKANKSGNISVVDNKKMNSLARVLGAPETKTAGVVILKKSGKINKGETIMVLHTESEKKLQDSLIYLKDSNPIIIK